MSGRKSTPLPERSSAVRVVALIAVVVVAITASTVAILHHRDKVKRSDGNGIPVPQLGGDELLFRSTSLDRDFGTLAVVPEGKPNATRGLAPMKCARVDYREGVGICLTPSNGILGGTSAKIFDASFHVQHTVKGIGNLPSCARLSPDGRYAAATTFVSGDSYAEAGFSTRSTIIDAQTGSTLLRLEKLKVTKDGARFFDINFNFWGVTFIPDSTRFYATLGTGNQTYLIEGDFATGTAHVITSGVECPSLSPDGKRIAFKERNSGNPITWHIAVLDLATMKKHTIPDAEKTNVDDQVEWLNDKTLMYAVPRDAEHTAKIGVSVGGAPVLGTGSSIATDTFTVDANGQGQPKMLIPGAWSAVPVSADS